MHISTKLCRNIIQLVNSFLISGVEPFMVFCLSLFEIFIGFEFPGEQAEFFEGFGGCYCRCGNRWLTRRTGVGGNIGKVRCFLDFFAQPTRSRLDINAGQCFQCRCAHERIPWKKSAGSKVLRHRRFGFFQLFDVGDYSALC